MRYMAAITGYHGTLVFKNQTKSTCHLCHSLLNDQNLLDCILVGGVTTTTSFLRFLLAARRLLLDCCANRSHIMTRALNRSKKGTT